jgi:RimJ/RimL family protein N-acetyltransferase
MILNGKYCYLELLDAQKSQDDLWEEIGKHDDIWEYTLTHSFQNKEDFTTFLKSCETHPSRTYFAIISNNKTVGILSQMDVSKEHKRLEIGGIAFGKSMQKTRVGTEAIYLILKYSFEDLTCNRVEWRCNKLNKPSEKSAARFGFIYEGMLRSHMETKGKIRDTLVFSIIKDEWSLRKRTFENWLSPLNFDENGKEKVKFGDI